MNECKKSPQISTGIAVFDQIDIIEREIYAVDNVVAHHAGAHRKACRQYLSGFDLKTCIISSDCYQDSSEETDNDTLKAFSLSFGINHLGPPERRLHRHRFRILPVTWQVHPPQPLQLLRELLQ